MRFTLDIGRGKLETLQLFRVKFQTRWEMVYAGAENRAGDATNRFPATIWERY